jgi:hypothetical protein
MIQKFYIGISTEVRENTIYFVSRNSIYFKKKKKKNIIIEHLFNFDVVLTVHCR